MYIFLEKLSSDFIVREHAPACTGRRQQYRFSRLGQFGTQLQAFLIGICETDLIKAMLSGTLGNLLSGLADEDKALYLAIKAMSKPTVLIGGGYDKQSEYDEWIAASGLVPLESL